MNYNIGPITDSLLNACATEITKKQTKDKIKNRIIMPLVGDIISECKTFIMLFQAVLLLIVILLGIIILLIKRK